MRKKYIVERIMHNATDGYYCVTVKGENHLNRTKIKSDIQFFVTEGGYNYNHPEQRALANAQAIANGLNQAGTAMELIGTERAEQLEKHFRSIDKDQKENNFFQLRDAAIGLLKMNPSLRDKPTNWSVELWGKMIEKPYDLRLVIAGALVAAEIDRISYNTHL